MARCFHAALISSAIKTLNMRLMISATVAVAAMVSVYGSASAADLACVNQCEQHKDSGERACHALDDYDACMRTVTEAAAACLRNCK
jgi:hypothetical protein